MNVDDIVDAIIESIPPKAEFSDTQQRDSEKLVRAAVMSLGTPYYFAFDESEKMIRSIEGKFECWLDWLDEAVLEGLHRLPKDYSDNVRGQVEGAYRMAKLFFSYVSEG